MSKLIPAIKVLKRNNPDDKIVSKQVECLGRLFFTIHYYNRSTGEESNLARIRAMREIARSERLNIPNELVCGVISSKCNSLKACFESLAVN